MTALAYPFAATFQAGSFPGPDEVASELLLIGLLRSAGFPESAGRRLEALQGRAPFSDAVESANNGANERHAIDVWLAEYHGSAARTFIPSATLNNEGLPRFVVAVPRDASEAVMYAVGCELAQSGADAELRNFLDEILIDEFAYIDFDPGIGFAALTAATAPNPPVATCAVSTVAGELLALDCAIESTGIPAGRLRVLRNAQGTVTTDSVVNELVTHNRDLVLYAGPAHAVPAVVHGALNAIREGRVAALAWRCVQRTGDAMLDAAAFNSEIHSAGTVLSVLGFSHFALAQVDDDVELIPLAAASGNSLIVSLSREYLARVGAP